MKSETINKKGEIIKTEYVCSFCYINTVPGKQEDEICIPCAKSLPSSDDFRYIP